MANLRTRPNSSKDRNIVGWFKPDGCCKKHPKHRQSPGVCSLCLKDKLSQLSSTSRKKTTSAIAASSCSSSASSLSSYYSSSSASSSASPIMHPFPFSTKGDSSSSSSSSVSIFMLSSSKHGLVKSRSIAVVPKIKRKDGEEGGVDDDHNKKSAKKSGFWVKLFHPKSKRSIKEMDTKLVHSRSVKETVTLAS